MSTLPSELGSASAIAGTPGEAEGESDTEATRSEVVPDRWPVTGLVVDDRTGGGIPGWIGADVALSPVGRRCPDFGLAFPANKPMKKTLCLALAAACLASASFAQGRKSKKIYSNSYIGKTPPDLTMAKGAAWLNSQTPLSLAKLKGRVVWLEFSFIH